MNTGAVVLLCLSGRHDQYCRQAVFNCLLSTPRLFPASEIPPQSRVFIPFSIPPSGFLVHAACVSTQLSGGHEKCHLDLVQE